MSEHSQDPSTHRLLQTRDGVLAVPRSQEGVPLRDYFKNTKLPRDLDRAVVYATDKGPVLAEPDPVGWSPEQDAKAQAHAKELHQTIERHGAYRKTLGMMAASMSRETGLPRDQTETAIIQAFTADQGKDPFQYLQTQREAQGLPTKERPGPEKRQDPSYEQG